MCDHAELSSIKLYPAFDRYFDDLSGTAEIKERKPMVSECIWACWDQTASYDISSDRWNIYRQGKNRSSRSLEDSFYSRWNLAAANFYLFLYGLTIELKKRGEKAEKNNLIHMILWYALVACLAHIAGGNYNDLIIGLIFLANYIQILMATSRMAARLEKAGYILEEYPERIPNGKCAWAAVLVTAVGILIGYGFWGSYRMNWAEKETTTNAECEEIRTHLLSLGFPETILDDLKEEDLLECRNARRVLTETNDYPINDGVEVAVSQDGYTQYSREYEKKELRLSGVAVELEKEGTWKVIHHFRWTEAVRFRGTEALQLFPAYRESGAHGSDRVI